MPSHILNLLLQLPGRPLPRSLEYHVLEKMRGTVGLIGLKSRASVDPDADGGRPGSEIGLGSDAEAGRESGDACLGVG